MFYKNYIPHRNPAHPSRRWLQEAAGPPPPQGKCLFVVGAFLFSFFFFFISIFSQPLYSATPSTPPSPIRPPSTSSVICAHVLPRYFGTSCSCDYGLVCIFDKSADDRRLLPNVKLATGIFFREQTWLPSNHITVATLNSPPPCLRYGNGSACFPPFNMHALDLRRIPSRISSVLRPC